MRGVGEGRGGGGGDGGGGGVVVVNNGDSQKEGNGLVFFGGSCVNRHRSGCVCNRR